NEFQVTVSALYWHVKDKQSLLGAMVDRLFADLDVDAPTGNWRADIAARAEQLYATMLSTRDAAELTASVLALGTGGQRVREITAPVSPQGLTTVAIMALLIGHATLHQQRMQAEAIGVEVSPPTTSIVRQVLDLLV